MRYRCQEGAPPFLTHLHLMPPREPPHQHPAPLPFPPKKKRKEKKALPAVSKVRLSGDPGGGQIRCPHRGRGPSRVKGFERRPADRLALDSATMDSLDFGGRPDPGVLPPRDDHLVPGRKRKRGGEKKSPKKLPGGWWCGGGLGRSIGRSVKQVKVQSVWSGVRYRFCTGFPNEGRAENKSSAARRPC